MPNVTLQHSDGSTECAVIPAETTLLAGLESVGATLVPVGCRGGGCGICRVQIVAGDYQRKKMSRLHVSEADEAQGITLSCRTVVKGDVTIVLATPEDILSQQQKTIKTNSKPY